MLLVPVPNQRMKPFGLSLILRFTSTVQSPLLMLFQEFPASADAVPSSVVAMPEPL